MNTTSNRDEKNQSREKTQKQGSKKQGTKRNGLHDHLHYHEQERIETRMTD